MQKHYPQSPCSDPSDIHDASSDRWKHMQSYATGSSSFTNQPHASQQRHPLNAHDAHACPDSTQHLSPGLVALDHVVNDQNQILYSEASHAYQNLMGTSQYQSGVSRNQTHRHQHATSIHPTFDVTQPTLTDSTRQFRAPIRQNIHGPYSRWSTSSSISRDTSAVSNYVESETLRVPLPSMTRPANYSSQHTGHPENNGEAEHIHNETTSYRCRWDVGNSPCNSEIIGRRACIEKHLRAHHRIQKDLNEVTCLWEGCTRRKMMKRENLARHLITHIGIQPTCPHCGKKFSRADAIQRHLDHVFRDRGSQGTTIAPNSREAGISSTFSHQRYRRD
ncbi:hypothetical protein V8B97DRAFT_794696 [Scleroderma yunnanense]